MFKIYLQNKEHRFDFDYDYKDDIILFKQENVNIYDIFKMENKYYVVCRINHTHDYAIAEPINFCEKGQSNKFEINLICPFCGYENGDSWELLDCSDDHECGRCASIISYERIIDVSYSAKPIKANNIKEI